jgi:uncharacterized MAPEG superfamily protein
MNTELTLLAWTAALAIVQVLVSSMGAMTQIPLPALAGNREAPLEARGWVGRSQRAHRNLLESLVPFTALVLVAHAAGISNATTVMGAQLFFYSRVVYAVVYVAGIPWLRTVVWTAGVVGMLMVLSQIL